MKKIISVAVMLSLFVLSFGAPVLAKGAKSGGFSRPSATKTSPSSTDSPAQGTTSQEKIPYTNLPASKTGSTSTGLKAPGAGFQNTSRGFMPSFTPFSGNFWLWMLLFNGFHQPAAPAAAADGAAAGEAAVEGSSTQAEAAAPELYDPSLSGYWKANPLANIVSTLIFVALIVLAFVFIRKLFRGIRQAAAR